MGLKTSASDCRVCTNLLAAYQHAVRTYTDFGLNGRRVLENDLLVAKEADRLRVNCSTARDAFMAHRCQNHDC